MSQKDLVPQLDGLVNSNIVLLVVSLQLFLGALMSSSVSVAIPTIGREFSVDAVTLTWINTAFLLSAVVIMIPIGRLADIYGRKRFFLIGVVFWAVSSLLCGLATSELWLVFFRAMHGVAHAFTAATSMAIVSSVFPPNRRGRAIGLTAASVYAGLTLGPTLGGIMTQQIGWRSIFFLNTVLCVFMLPAIMLKIRAEWADARGHKLDIVGSILFGLMLVTAVYGLSLLPNPTGIYLLIVTVVSLVLFVVWSDRAADPVLDLKLFRHNVVFAMSNLATLINYAATYALTFMLSLFLQYVRGFDAQTAGLILLIEPLIMGVFSPFTGRLSDRFEPRMVASLGMAVTTVGLAMIAFSNDEADIMYYLVALVVAGLGLALFSSPNTNAVMGAVSKSELGVASATVGVMRALGQNLSMAITALLLSMFVGSAEITAQNQLDFSQGFHLTVLVFAVLCAVGVFCSAARGKVHVADAGPAS
jgi:EmrB/QacA subfamily drug resistance transporter